MTSPSSPWTPRFGLRSLLVVVLFVAVLLAWYADHRRQAMTLRLTKLELEIYEQQNKQLTSQLAQRHGGGMQMIYFWASADEFIQALTHVEDDYEFLGMAGSLASSDETVMDNSVQQLVVLLADTDERTRRRAVNTLRFLKEKSRSQSSPEVLTVLDLVLDRNADAVTRGLLPLLDNQQTSGAEAYYTLKTFGPDANSALGVLRAKMADSSNLRAVFAAEAVAAIDPKTDIGPRLIEFVEQQHVDWGHAAWLLPDHVPPAESRRVLTALYDRLEQEGDRQTVINALNKIPAEPTAAPAP